MLEPAPNGPSRGRRWNTAAGCCVRCAPLRSLLIASLTNARCKNSATAGEVTDAPIPRGGGGKGPPVSVRLSCGLWAVGCGLWAVGCVACDMRSAMICKDAMQLGYCRRLEGRKDTLGMDQTH